MIHFIKSSWDEITNHVTWPTREQLQSTSVLVLVASLVFALVVGSIDTVFGKILRLIYN